MFIIKNVQTLCKCLKETKWTCNIHGELVFVWSLSRWQVNLCFIVLICYLKVIFALLFDSALTLHFCDIFDKLEMHDSNIFLVKVGVRFFALFIRDSSLGSSLLSIHPVLILKSDFCFLWTFLIKPWSDADRVMWYLRHVNFHISVTFLSKLIFILTGVGSNLSS
jgi:hypothetical protein